MGWMVSISFLGMGSSSVSAVPQNACSVAMERRCQDRHPDARPQHHHTDVAAAAHLTRPTFSSDELELVRLGSFGGCSSFMGSLRALVWLCRRCGSESLRERTDVG